VADPIKPAAGLTLCLSWLRHCLRQRPFGRPWSRKRRYPTRLDLRIEKRVPSHALRHWRGGSDSALTLAGPVAFAPV